MRAGPPAPAPPLIHGDGSAEADWQACDVLRAVPGVPLDTLLPRGSRLVVVAPHPDDELLACGGLLAAHVARGGLAQVLAVTDGEGSHPDCPEWSPPALAAARRAESLAGLQRLLRPHPVAASIASVRHGLGLADGGIGREEARLAALLQQALHAGDVVVTTWQRDGHPDHEACGRAAAAACRAVGCRLLQAPVWMWHWARCGDARVPWSQLRGLALHAQAWSAKQHALDAHGTQLQARGNGLGPVLGAQILQRAQRRLEYFFIE